MADETAEAGGEEKAAAKKKNVADLLAETAEVLSALTERQDVLETRVGELAGQTEAHRMLLLREETISAEHTGLKRGDYPGVFHKSVEQGVSSWSLVTPKCDYLPGITINGFTVPFRTGISMEVCTPFLEEAVGRGLL